MFLQLVLNGVKLLLISVAHPKRSAEARRSSLRVKVLINNFSYHTVKAYFATTTNSTIVITNTSANSSILHYWPTPSCIRRGSIEE